MSHCKHYEPLFSTTQTLALHTGTQLQPAISAVESQTTKKVVGHRPRLGATASFDDSLASLQIPLESLRKQNLFKIAFFLFFIFVHCRAKCCQ